jgi:predicted permease
VTADHAPGLDTSGATIQVVSQRQSPVRTALAGLTGNVLEWFDFVVYGGGRRCVRRTRTPRRAARSGARAQVVLTGSLGPRLGCKCRRCLEGSPDVSVGPPSATRNRTLSVTAASAIVAMHWRAIPRKRPQAGEQPVLKDVRHAVRMLLHAKGWTVVVVLSLALGIGANTALFTAVNGLLLVKLPVQEPDTLVRLRWTGENDMVTSSSDYGFTGRHAGQTVRTTFSYPMYQQFVAENRTMTDLFACAPISRVNVIVDGQAEIASAFASSGNYSRVLGVTARIGRTILPEDDHPGAPPVAVISSRYWHARFGTDPEVLGKTVRINGVPVTIVGVLPPDFTGVQQPTAQAPDISVPLAVDPQLSGDPQLSERGSPPRLSQPTYWWLQVMGRLKPGATPAQVRGNLDGVFQHTARAGLDSYLAGLSEEARSTAMNRDRTRVPRLLVEPGGRGVYDVNTNELRAVTILSVVVVLVLLLVCANVANLLLSRATARQKELSVRLSLGATRLRLVRQLLTESLLLAAIGGALGILVGYWGHQLLPGAASRTTLDWRILAFVLAITVVTGIVFGVAPALRASGVNVGAALKETGRGIAGSRSLLGRSLLVIQVAISLVLLVGAGLFLRTLQNLRHVDVGFNPQNLLLFRVSPQFNRYDEKKAPILYRDLLDRLPTVPGVGSVAMSQPALLSGSVNSTSIYIQGRVYPAGREDLDNDIHRLVVSPGFFDVMGIPIPRGRGFTERDAEGAPRVVMINEAAARKYFPNENPIGQRFGSSRETAGQLEIVGVARDVKYNSVRDEAPPTMFVPYRQARLGSAVFEVRTAGNPTAVVNGIREAVRGLDPDLPLMDVSTQIEQVERRFSQEKLFAQAYTLFGALALTVASIGLFGLMSYNVSRRTNEIGIRMALGARREDVLRLVMREAMVLVAIGVAVGLAIAASASQFVATLLFGLAARDVTTMAMAMGVMAVVSAVAGYLPARRASRVDPMVALRYE